MISSILFLDLDDVLIVPALHKIKSRRRVRDGRKVHHSFLPSARVHLLSILAACPDAAVVISSTWRLEPRIEMDTVLRLNGCGEVVERLHEDWRTCGPASQATRADEIAEWLLRHPEVTRAVAIDNDPSIAGRSWAVLVDPATGLTAESVSAATALLLGASS
jgi:hypothetical protein